MTTTRIVAAIDGSPVAERALAFAVEEAEVRGVPLTVVAARPTLSARWSGDARLAPPLDTATAEDMQSLAEEMLAEVARERGKPNTAATSIEVLNGPPAEIIEEFLRPSDLLVIGSRGIGGVRRLLLGSVSSALVQAAPCPVVVVRPAPASETGRPAGR
jgi:nucleotide-binding universal stress UspA family protein